MLRNSFILLPGIGPVRESGLWRQGIASWDEFLRRGDLKGISGERKSRLDAELLLADERLREEDSPYFAARLPSREQWRCLKEFGGSVAYLDIETTGVSVSSPITVVGIYDGTRMHTLVRGRDLTAVNLRAMLGSVTMLVTFNGSGFDLPMIEAQFPGTIPRIPHVDLRFPLRRLGLRGGLKRIERDLGLERDRRVEYMTGEDAVYLWKLWSREGKRNALDLLLEYNAADCVNLKSLANYTYNSLKRRVYDLARSPGKD